MESLARKLPQTMRYTKQQLNFWRDLAWHQTVGHARDWLALSMATDEPAEAVRAFLDRAHEPRPGRARHADRGRSPEPAGGPNALSDALMDELVARLAELDADDEVRCIVLAGDERAFAAGADIAELAAATAVESTRLRA